MIFWVWVHSCPSLSRVPPTRKARGASCACRVSAHVRMYLGTQHEERSLSFISYLLVFAERAGGIGPAGMSRSVYRYLCCKTSCKFRTNLQRCVRDTGWETVHRTLRAVCTYFCMQQHNSAPRVSYHTYPKMYALICGG